MFGKKSRLTSLGSRKQLLVAESELNRVQLASDLVQLREEVQVFTHRAKSYGAIVSTVAVLLAGLTVSRRSKSEGAKTKPSWWQSLLKGVSLISTLWMAFRPPGQEQKAE